MPNPLMTAVGDRPLHSVAPAPSSRRRRPHAVHQFAKRQNQQCSNSSRSSSNRVCWQMASRGGGTGCTLISAVRMIKACVAFLFYALVKNIRTQWQSALDAANPSVCAASYSSSSLPLRFTSSQTKALSLAYRSRSSRLLPLSLTLFRTHINPSKVNNNKMLSFSFNCCCCCCRCLRTQHNFLG